MNKCIGCGTLLQSVDSKKEGYCKGENQTLCERCFRIRNYNEYQVVEKENGEFVSILKEIDKTNDLVILVADLFMLPKSLSDITKYFQKKCLLVLTKRDILPKRINEQRILDNFKNFLDVIIISSAKNYHFDELMDKIKMYQKSSNVYVVGFTNAGKSTMINKIIKNYSDSSLELTTSMIPSTTLNMISIPIDDSLTLIDTPGILEPSNLTSMVDSDTLKKLIPKKGIRPMTYQVKCPTTFLVEDFLQLECQENNITFYLSNALKIERVYKKGLNNCNLIKHEIEIKAKEDLVIQGLCFITFSKKEKVVCYVKDDVCVYTRRSLF